MWHDLFYNSKLSEYLAQNFNRATPAIYMLCVENTCRVQALPAAAVFLLLYTRRIGQILLLLLDY